MQSYKINDNYSKDKLENLGETIENFQIICTFGIEMQKRDLQIFNIALPAIVTNITVPLLGLVDTGIVGHMGSAVYIAAIAVGSMVFNLVYWVFGFLRMGTSGLTAQARGRRDNNEIARLLMCSFLVAFVIALIILLLQCPLREGMFWLMSPTDDVRPVAIIYYNIVVWGAPAMLGLYALCGWFLGMQNTWLPMVISISQNVINILVSLLLVYGWGMKVEGVALGTVVAQYAGFAVGIFLLFRYFRRYVVISWCPLKELIPFLSVNKDIFLRTLCLVAVNLYFTSVGARQGATILAVNALLMQLFLLFSYVMDAFAYAGAALGGRYWGAQNGTAFREVVQRLFVWGAVMTVAFTALYVLGGLPFLQLLTDQKEVVVAAQSFVWWAYLIPVAGVAAFIWDGIFIGITQTRGMLLSAVVAAGIFFLTILFLTPYWGNHALWLAMLLFLLFRGLIQSAFYYLKCGM